MNQKGFAPVLIIFLVGVLAIGVGYYFYSRPNQQPSITTNTNVAPTKAPASESSNWETYTDNLLGFSIQYPRGWNIKDNQLVKSNNCNQKDKDCKDSSITFSSGSKDIKQSLKDYILNLKITKERGEPQLTSEDEKYIPYNIISLKGIEANFMGMYGPINVYIPIDELKVLAISFFNIDSDTIYQILSTFKFTQLSSDTKQFQVYKSRDSLNVGFYFNIPEGWKVNYRDEGQLNNSQGRRIDFDFAPPGWVVPKEASGWMGWGSMAVDVYPSASTIQDWNKANLTKYQKDLKITDKQIGNKKGYKVTFPSNSEIPVPFSYNVVLGDKYSYTVGPSSQNKAGSDEPEFIPDDLLKYFYFD